MKNNDPRMLAVRFAEWMRLNFTNNPQEMDNLWEDTMLTMTDHPKRYTTEELWSHWYKNVCTIWDTSGRKSIESDDLSMRMDQEIEDMSNMQEHIRSRALESLTCDCNSDQSCPNCLP